MSAKEIDVTKYNRPYRDTVYGYKDLTTSGPCFADFFNEKRFSLKTLLDKETTDKYLQMIQSEEPFEYEWDKKDERLLHFTLSRSGRNYVVLIGNLIKGISEFAFLGDAIVEDKSNDTFFEKSFRAFKERIPKMSGDYNSNHGWHETTYTCKDGKYTVGVSANEEKRWMGLTITELFLRFKALNIRTGAAWATVAPSK